MIHSDFLDNYITLQQGIIFDEVIPLSPEAIIAFCQKDEATDWNFALVKKLLSEEEITTIEQAFLKLQRSPSIYFENKHALSPLKELLVKKGYKRSYEDSWMFYEQSSVNVPEEYKVIRVSNDQELQLFLDIFNKSFQKDDPQNPYGEWGEGYVNAIADSWYKHNQRQ